MPDDAHGPQPFHMLRLSLLQAQPDVIYVPSTMDAAVLDHLNGACTQQCMCIHHVHHNHTAHRHRL